MARIDFYSRMAVVVCIDRRLVTADLRRWPRDCGTALIDLVTQPAVIIICLDQHKYLQLRVVNVKSVINIASEW